MSAIYALCSVCDAVVVPPTEYAARLDGQAQVHARLTGHPIDVIAEDDPDEIRYRIAGEPALPL